MPLSEEELRLLEQMERALVEEDPKFASALRGTTLRRHARRRAAIAGVVFLVGVVGLMSGAILEMAYLGIAGFVVMLVSAVVGLSAIRGHGAATAAPADAPASGLRVIDGGRLRGRRPGRPPGRQAGRQPRHGHTGGSFMDRMEARWRRRRENGF